MKNILLKLFLFLVFFTILWTTSNVKAVHFCEAFVKPQNRLLIVKSVEFQNAITKHLIILKNKFWWLEVSVKGVLFFPNISYSLTFKRFNIYSFNTKFNLKSNVALGCTNCYIFYKSKNQSFDAFHYNTISGDLENKANEINATDYSLKDVTDATLSSQSPSKSEQLLVYSRYNFGTELYDTTFMNVSLISTRGTIKVRLDANVSDEYNHFLEYYHNNGYKFVGLVLDMVYIHQIRYTLVYCIWFKQNPECQKGNNGLKDLINCDDLAPSTTTTSTATPSPTTSKSTPISTTVSTKTTTLSTTTQSTITSTVTQNEFTLKPTLNSTFDSNPIETSSVDQNSTSKTTPNSKISNTTILVIVLVVVIALIVLLCCGLTYYFWPKIRRFARKRRGRGSPSLKKSKKSTRSPSIRKNDGKTQKSKRSGSPSPTKRVKPKK